MAAISEELRQDVTYVSCHGYPCHTTSTQVQVYPKTILTHLYDAITLEIWRRPSVLASGNTYDRDALAIWLCSSNVEPLTGAELPQTVCAAPCYTLFAALLLLEEREDDVVFHVPKMDMRNLLQLARHYYATEPTTVVRLDYEHYLQPQSKHLGGKTLQYMDITDTQQTYTGYTFIDCALAPGLNLVGCTVQFTEHAYTLVDLLCKCPYTGLPLYRQGQMVAGQWVHQALPLHVKRQMGSEQAYPRVTDLLCETLDCAAAPELLSEEVRPEIKQRCQVAHAELCFPEQKVEFQDFYAHTVSQAFYNRTVESFAALQRQPKFAARQAQLSRVIGTYLQDGPGTNGYIQQVERWRQFYGWPLVQETTTYGVDASMLCFVEMKWEAKDWKNNNFAYCTFTNCIFSGVRFALCNFVGATFEKCMFVNCKFVESNKWHMCRMSKTIPMGNTSTSDAEAARVKAVMGGGSVTALA